MSLQLQKGSCAWKGCTSMKNKWINLSEGIKVRSCKKHRVMAYLEESSQQSFRSGK